MNTGKIWRWAVVLVQGVTIFGITMCAPTPEPTPTPDAVFSTEAEAFAAAEETYRAYFDALNQVDVSDPKTFEPLFALTTGEAYESDRKTMSEYHARKWTKTGDVVVTSFSGTEFDPDSFSVAATACLDVSGTLLTDSAGESVVPPERADTYSVDLGFDWTGSDLKISTSYPTPDEACASR